MIWSIVIAVVIVVGTLIGIECGFRWGIRDLARNGDSAHEGLAPLEASALALLGLLIAFSFSGAITRFEAKRALVLREANAMGTAYMRVDLLPTEAQPAIRAEFKRMLDARLAAYQDRAVSSQAGHDLQAFTAAQKRIWALAVAAVARSSRDVGMLVLPPINDMVDVATTRQAAFTEHLPSLVVVLLAGSAVISGLLAGYTLSKRRVRSWLHNLGYAAILALTIYTIFDIDFPRFGLINLEDVHQSLYDLRRSMP